MTNRFRFIALVCILLCSLFLLAQNSTSGRPALEVRLVEVSFRGFNPPEVRWQTGTKLLILVRNTTGGPLHLRLDRDQGERVGEVQLVGTNSHWKEILNLSPGVYWLTETNHPEWKCKFMVDAGI